MLETVDEIKVEGKVKNFTKRPYIIALIFFILSMVFKLMHWPGGLIFQIICPAIILSYALTSIIVLKKTLLIDLIFLITFGIWFLFMLSGYISNRGVKLYLITFFLFFIFYFLMKKYKIYKLK